MVQVALSIWYKNGTYENGTWSHKKLPTAPTTSIHNHHACSVLAMLLVFLAMLLRRLYGLGPSAFPP
jgi:hypothetical protein